jgi:hypothetical protein
MEGWREETMDRGMISWQMGGIMYGCVDAFFFI